MGETFTIQISSELIRRLTNDTRSTMAKKAKPKVSHEQPPQPRGKTNSVSNVEKSLSHPGILAQQAPMFLSAPPGSLLSSPVNTELEAIKSTLLESEKVVEKLEKQEANMVQELTQRAKELHEKEFRLPYQKTMPCLGEREDCLKCYKEYLNDPLKCASAVRKFSDCARQARRQAA